MAEYLSPGVYVEEFDSGIKAMEGVGTSTAGFVGMAQKGPIQGLPVLITSMADYQRRFGGYLPERTYGDMRFLPYAVEQFFNNGGSSCYVMRVCGDAASAKGVFVGVDKENQFLELCASNPGAWGSRLQAKLAAVLKNRAEVTGVDGAKVTVKDAGSYQKGDIACLQTITTVQTDDKSETSVTLSYHYIDSVEGSAVT
ncbi:MAG: phage tail sheath family protein, partial [Acetatifactor sp.]|nr:phage tail sheath family protein [Acetatifactor sp.]